MVFSLIRRKIWALIMIGFALILSTHAFANDNASDEQVAHFETLLAEQQQSPGAEAAAQDIEQVREWLANAKVLLARGDDKAASALLRRVGVGVDLIVNITKVAEIQQAADDQESAYFIAEQEQIPELEEEIENLTSKKKELEAELDTLR